MEFKLMNPVIDERAILITGERRIEKRRLALVGAAQ
jgi:hypothetical protein